MTDKNNSILKLILDNNWADLNKYIKSILDEKIKSKIDQKKKSIIEAINEDGNEDNSIDGNELLTKVYGRHQGLNADWVGKAWQVEDNIWIVDDEADEHDSYSVIRRDISVESEPEDDDVLFTGDAQKAIDFVNNLNEREAINEAGGLSEMGDGHEIEYDGEVSIPRSLKSKYSNKITDYYNSLSALSEDVVKALDSLGLTAIAENEKWIGGYFGALSDQETARMRLELVYNNKKVKNSLLILNIQKDNSRSKVYELNSYLS